jgi:hypothetical protein
MCDKLPFWWQFFFVGLSNLKLLSIIESAYECHLGG